MWDRNYATGNRAVAALTVAWVTLNCAAVVIDLSERESVRPEPTRPSSLALSLFESHAAPHNVSAGLTGCRLDYRLLAPPAAASPESFPLLVFLHGAGERGADNERQLLALPQQMCQPEWRRRFPCYVLAPQCPEGGDWSTFMPDLESLVDHLRTLPSVDPQRVYLTGFSMGGYGAWGLAARRPDLFAAVVPVCGGGDPRWGQALAAVPIWAVHGADDDVVPVQGSRDMIAAIRLAGGQPRYTELPGVRHDSWPQTYRDPHGVVAWMFDQGNQQRPRQTSPGP